MYSFDALDRLWQMTNGSQDWRHMYTADGERLFSYDRFGPSRWILRDLDGKILREYENAGVGNWTVVKDYVYRGNHAAAIYTGSAAVRALTDSNGTRFSYHLFYPFGEEATSITQDAGRLKFTGHERDLGDFYSAADDLDYMHARFRGPSASWERARPSADRRAPGWNHSIGQATGPPLDYGKHLRGVIEQVELESVKGLSLVLLRNSGSVRRREARWRRPGGVGPRDVQGVYYRAWKEPARIELMLDNILAGWPAWVTKAVAHLLEETVRRIMRDFRAAAVLLTAAGWSEAA